jgi:two-component system, NarL family, response regulator DegU
VKLLIVDDNSGIRAVIRKILEKEFDSIYELSDGNQALSVYETMRPDWVTMDIKMGHMDGITATSEIIKRFPDARIIITTQYPYTEFREAAEKAGAYGYVLKDRLFEIKSLIRRK